MTIQQHVKDNTYILDHIVAEFLSSSDKNKIQLELNTDGQEG